MLAGKADIILSGSLIDIDIKSAATEISENYISRICYIFEIWHTLTFTLYLSQDMLSTYWGSWCVYELHKHTFKLQSYSSVAVRVRVKALLFSLSLSTDTGLQTAHSPDSKQKLYCSSLELMFISYRWD